MYTEFVATLLSAAPPAASAVYAQAGTTIQDYAAWVAAQSLPSGSNNYPNWPTANSVLGQLKADALAWINKIFPETLQFPATFALQAQGVTGQLTTLGSLVNQLSGGVSDPPVVQQIQTLIGQILPTVTALQYQSAALAGSLDGFRTAMVSDTEAAQNEVNALQQDGAVQQSVLANANGQLQYERSKSCPSSGTERSLQNTINQATAEVSAINSLLGLFAPAAQQTAGCTQSLGYLGNYWGALSADVAGCAQVLQKAATDPVALLAIDLQTVQSQWQQTLTFLQQAGAACLA